MLKTAPLMLVVVLAGCGVAETNPGARNPGLLDPAFGTSGATLTSLDNEGRWVRALAQTERGFVVGGTASLGWVLVGHTTQGLRDSGFGKDGVLKLFSSDSPYGGVRKLIVRRDGRLLALGGTSTHDRLRQFSPAGTEDTAFSHQLDSYQTLLPYIFAFGLLPDDRLVLTDGKRVVRVHADGARDFTFGAADGSMPAPFGEGTIAVDVLVRPDGKLAVGAVRKQKAIVMLLTAEGLLDSAFGTNGATELPEENNSPLFALQGNQILVANGGSLFRLTATGVLDPTFGTNGRADAPRPAGGHAHINAIHCLADGTLATAGAAHAEGAELDSWSVARFSANGAAGTHQLFDLLGPASGGASDLVETPAGLVVAGTSHPVPMEGYSPNYGPPDFAIARLAR